jgi:small-conductance mechanosensitive channel
VALIVAVVLLALLVGAIAQRLARWLLRRADPEIQLFASRIAHISVLVAGLLVALSIAGVHAAALAALLGALGLAVSFSLQDLAKNLVAGVYLLLERLFRAGDRITLRTFTGHVEVIDLRTTTLIADDGRHVVVPNTLIMSEIMLKEPGQARRG